MDTICKKASKQINALFRLRNVLDTSGKLKLYYAFIRSYFNHCPLVWHLCRIQKSKKMEKIQHRALKFVFNDSESSYSKLLECANSCSLVNWRLKCLSVEIFKNVHIIGPSCPLSGYFEFRRSHYDLRFDNRLSLKRFNTMTYGQNSISHKGTLLWNSLPSAMRQCTDLHEFSKLADDFFSIICCCGTCYSCVCTP